LQVPEINRNRVRVNFRLLLVLITIVQALRRKTMSPRFEANLIGGDPVTALIPLSGLVGGVDGTAYADENEVVDYHGALTTSMTLQGCTDASPKYITFRVGVRGARANIPRPIDAHRIDTSIAIVEEIRKMVQDMGRRSSAMPVTWDRMDLFGVIRRLSMGCAFYSKWGGITPAELRGGGNANVAAIAATVEPIAADNGAVFASAKLVGHSRPNIMCALVNAVSGEGGTLYTDLLAVNNAGAVQVPNSTGAALAQGCHEASRILGAMYKACDKGAFYALAVTEGQHRITSVHGHTTEGAFARDVMRATEGGVPYGAIVTDIDPDNAMPSPQKTVAGFRAVYDGIALATAGAVALADPMVDYHGRDYPTVLTSDQGAITDPGDDGAGDGADAADLSTQWAENCGPWARNYAKALNLIFSTSGGLEEVERLLVTQANSLAGQDNRHLRVKVATAFFWTEPSCSCPVGDVSFPAFNACHGPLATSNASRSVPALDGCALLTSRSDNMRSTIQVDFRFTRRHGLFVHLAEHVRNGLDSIRLDSGVVNDFLLVGGAGDIGPRVMAGNTLDTYLWGRSLSTIPAGAEFTSLSKTNVFTIEHTRVAGASLRNTHTPFGSEAIGGDVLYTASRLVGVAPAAPGAVPGQDVRRARSQASIALSLAADSGRSEYIINAQVMRPTLIDFGDLPADARAPRDRAEIEVEPPDPGAVDGVNPVIPDNEVEPRAGHAPRRAPANGPNAPINIENRAERGPRAPRAGRIGGGGIVGGGGFLGGGAGVVPPVVGGGGAPPPNAVPPDPGPGPPQPPNLPPGGPIPPVGGAVG
jgi:hypothetical protein